jgi:molybdopterin synthase catalytic subunit
LAFTGIARADTVNGKMVLALELEHYPEMAEKAFADIVTEACKRWPIKACDIVHRVGRVDVGEVIVLVQVAAEHRKAALAAVDFIMDFLKNDVPIWKKEIFADQSLWVEQKVTDKAAKNRW